MFKIVVVANNKKLYHMSNVIFKLLLFQYSFEDPRGLITINRRFFICLTIEWHPMSKDQMKSYKKVVVDEVL